MASEADADYRVRLTDAYLKVRKVRIGSSISVAHELALKKGPTVYPIRQVECKSFIVAGGNPSLRKDVFNGLLPKTFVFGLVDSDAFNDAYKKIPFNFKNCTVSYLGISVNSQEIPFRPLKLSYAAATPKFIEAYATLFSRTGKINYDVGNDISREDYPNGYTFYALDLMPDMCGSSARFNVMQKGNLAIDIQSPLRTMLQRVLCVTENLKTPYTSTRTETSFMIIPDEY